jgi:glucose-1-phosphate thymidylyltransferase
MLAGLREIAIITAPSQKNNFTKLIGDGSDLGLEITYMVQEIPIGIPHSLLIAESFIDNDKCALILGDNIFHGSGLGRRLSMFNQIDGSQVFGYRVKNPSSYGIATLDDTGTVLNLSEKPLKSISSVAIPGIYFFDNLASKFVKSLKPSLRGELEIIDLIEQYRVNDLLRLEMLPRGTAWFDSGTFEDLHEASAYVRIMQERTGERVGDPYEIAKIHGWI